MSRCALAAVNRSERFLETNTFVNNNDLHFFSLIFVDASVRTRISREINETTPFGPYGRCAYTTTSTDHENGGCRRLTVEPVTQILRPTIDCVFRTNYLSYSVLRRPPLFGFDADRRLPPRRRINMHIRTILKQ